MALSLAHVRILFAAHPELLAPVLRIVHRVITRFLLKQAGEPVRTRHTGPDADLRLLLAHMKLRLPEQPPRLASVDGSVERCLRIDRRLTPPLRPEPTA